MSRDRGGFDENGSNGGAVGSGEGEGQSDQFIGALRYVREQKVFEDGNALVPEEMVTGKVFAVDGVNRWKVKAEEADPCRQEDFAGPGREGRNHGREGIAVGPVFSAHEQAFGAGWDFGQLDVLFFNPCIDEEGGAEVGGQVDPINGFSVFEVVVGGVGVGSRVQAHGKGTEVDRGTVGDPQGNLSLEG